MVCAKPSVLEFTLRLKKEINQWPAFQCICDVCMIIIIIGMYRALLVTQVLHNLSKEKHALPKYSKTNGIIIL